MPQIIDKPCPGYEEAMECVFQAGEGDVYGGIYPRGAVFVVDGDRFATEHGLGHIFDVTMMDDGERSAFEHALGRIDEQWSFTFVEDGRVVQSPASLAETFADAYANCRLGRVVASGRAWEAGYDYYPTAREHRRICGIITRAGRDPAPPVSPPGSAE